MGPHRNNHLIMGYDVFFSSDYAELSDAFLLYGLRTEFKRKATYAVEGAETTFDRVTQISQITQIFLIVSFYVPQIPQIYTDF